jgi:hypothetical protein
MVMPHNNLFQNYVENHELYLCIRLLTHVDNSNSVQYFSVYMSVAIFSGLSLPIVSLTVFRDYSYSKNVISINNRCV